MFVPINFVNKPFIIIIIKTKINCEFIENGLSEDRLKKLLNDSNNMNMTSNLMKIDQTRP